MILGASVIPVDGCIVASLSSFLNIDRISFSYIEETGMAMRLSLDLGLHIDMSDFVAQGSISKAEADLRCKVFWGAYTMDQ